MAMAMDDSEFGGFMGGNMLGVEEDNDPVTRLKRIISERETETLQVLQDWIEEPSAKANT
jgi:flagellar M-ring protein FliF